MPPEVPGLWVPDESAPATPRPAPAGAAPCLVSEWTLRPGSAGRVEARPVHSWLSRPLAVVKEDRGPERLRRFVRAWSEVLAARAAAGAGAGSGGRAHVARWVRAGVLVPAPAPGAGRRPRGGA
jgi:hypothetical protein